MSQLLRVAGFLPYLSMIFLNAFVDLGHKIIIQNTLFKTYDGEMQVLLTAVVNALILLPFVLLFTPSGYLADRFSKVKVMRVSAWAALLITAGITLFYYQGWFWAAFTMTFLLAVQSAIYSPAKYGYIKELVGKEQLTVGNGWVQGVTTTAILAGIFVFSVLFESRVNNMVGASANEIMVLIAPIGFVLMAGTLLELIFAYRLTATQPCSPRMAFNWGAYGRGETLRKNISAAWQRRVIRLSMIGLSVFWAISQVLLAAFPAYAKETLEITNTVVIQGMLASSGLGIILGSLLAARWSRNHIETGLIPLGAVGVAVSLFVLPSLDSTWALSLNFVLLGALGGLFIVPLNALIQFHGGDRALGRILAANNFIQNVVMLSFLTVTMMVVVWVGSSAGIMWSLGVIALVGALYTLAKLPQSLLRFVLAVVFSSRYRLQVEGLKNMPAEGGVLMLGNHISWIDWILLSMASPRSLRFVMERSIYETTLLKHFFALFGAVPISSSNSKASLKAINALLREGEVVCLFPEGGISRNGQLGEFKQGFERVVNEVKGVILPFYLHGLWGSRFSRASGKLKHSRRPGYKRDVVVSFGDALPIDSKSATVKQAVFELSVSSWQQRMADQTGIAERWLRTACQNRGQTAVIDSVGTRLNKRRFITATALFSKRINALIGDQNVAVLLPASSAGAIANMSVLLSGKTVVNLNYTASAKALQAGMNKAEVRHVLTSSRFLRKLAGRGIDVDALFANVQLHFMEDMKAGMGKLETLAVLFAATVLPARVLMALFGQRVAADDTAAILFSSGSEGTPKGIELSHRNIIANVVQVSDVLNTETKDVVMANLPLFHAFGLTVTTFMPLLEGMPMVCHPDPTDALGTAKAIARYEATVMCSTSTFLRLYNRNKRIHPLMLQSLRVVVAGAERLNPEVKQAFALKFGKAIYEGYGATETTPVASVNLPDRLDPTTWKIQLGSKPGTVGMPLPGSSFRIVDPVSLTALPVGEDGLILIGGVQVMKGYLKDADKTAEVVIEKDDQRWYKTGDKGHLDKDGFLTIVDRYSRFAKLAGEMVSLSQVEQAVLDQLGDSDSDLELLAVNVPDDKKGERIVLLVAADRDVQALRKALLASSMNPLMVPAEIIQVAEIPKLGSGKINVTAAKQWLLNKKDSL